MKPTKVCVVCGKEFVPYHDAQKVCSYECSEKRREEYDATRDKHAIFDHAPRLCALCGKEFIPKNRVNITCSAECSEQWRRLRDYENRKRYAEHTNERKSAAATTAFRRECVRNSRQALAEDCKAARAAGLSYGMWRTLQAAQKPF